MKPILFNTEMVRAILDGRKTVTRRVVKIIVNDDEPVPHFRCNSVRPAINKNGLCANFYDMRGFYCGAAKQVYCPGDILYVRETWCELPVNPDGSSSGNKTCVYYRADGDIRPDGWREKWRPSIHMPKEAARIFLRVTNVRVERLQDITEEGKTAEGLHPGWQHYNFYELWDSTIKKAELPRYGWEANPWVWVIEFERISKEAATS